MQQELHSKLFIASLFFHAAQILRKLTRTVLRSSVGIPCRRLTSAPGWPTENLLEFSGGVHVQGLGTVPQIGPRSNAQATPTSQSVLPHPSLLNHCFFKLHVSTKFQKEPILNQKNLNDI